MALYFEVIIKTPNRKIHFFYFVQYIKFQICNNKFTFVYNIYVLYKYTMLSKSFMYTCIL